MKTLAIFALTTILCSAAHAVDGSLLRDNTWDRGGCKGQFLNDCEEFSKKQHVGPNKATCYARDSFGARFEFTASYQHKTSYIVAGAIAACAGESADRESCHWTACVWAD